MFGYAFTALLPDKKVRSVATTAMLVLLLANAPAMRGVGKQEASRWRLLEPAPQSNAIQSNVIHSVFQLHDLGVPDAIIFRGVAASRDIAFALPQTEVPQHATLNLNYAFSPGLIPQISHLNVLLNGVLVSSFPMPDNKNEQLDRMHAIIDLPAELLVRKNVLTFEFVGHYTYNAKTPPTQRCGRASRTPPASTSPAFHSLSTTTSSFCPSPSTMAQSAAPSPPSRRLRLASQQPRIGGGRGRGLLVWSPCPFAPAGLSGDCRLTSSLRQRNSPRQRYIDMPPGLDLKPGGPTVAIRTNPIDPFGKLLIIAGSDGDQLLAAARGLALGNSLLQGRTFSVTDMQLPSPLRPTTHRSWLIQTKSRPSGTIPARWNCRQTAPDPWPSISAFPPISTTAADRPCHCTSTIATTPSLWRTTPPCASARTARSSMRSRFLATKTPNKRSPATLQFR